MHNRDFLAKNSPIPPADRLLPVLSHALIDPHPVEFDAIRVLMDGLMRKQEQLVTRMLCAWDPAWGEPILVEKHPSDLQIPRWDEPEKPYEATAYICGLARDSEPFTMAHLLVRAVDHVDEQGNVLPPIEDRGMLRLFRERLAARKTASML